MLLSFNSHRQPDEVESVIFILQVRNLRHVIVSLSSLHKFLLILNFQYTVISGRLLQYQIKNEFCFIEFALNIFIIILSKPVTLHARLLSDNPSKQYPPFIDQARDKNAGHINCCFFHILVSLYDLLDSNHFLRLFILIQSFSVGVTSILRENSTLRREVIADCYAFSVHPDHQPLNTHSVFPHSKFAMLPKGY